MTTQSQDLSPEERKFRALLLESAKRLDVPSSDRLPTALAHVEAHATHWTASLTSVFSRHGVLWSCIGLAASTFLYLRSMPKTPSVVLKAEPIAQTRNSLAHLEGRPSASSAEPSTTTRPEKLNAPPIRGASAKPSAIAMPTSTPMRMTTTDVPTPPHPSNVDPEQTILVRQSLEQRNVPPDFMARHAEEVARTDAGKSNASPVLVWDGDRIGLHASGWSGPDKTSKTIEVVPRVGFAHTNGLVWRAHGSDWIGFGWNWFSWWPSDAGTDISQHRQLVFRLRIEATVPEQRPEPKGFLVTLRSSTGSGKRSTNTVQFARGVHEDLGDGEWHKIAVLLMDLGDGERAQGFDATHAWEFDLGYWSKNPTTFTAYVDDIGFE